MLRCEFSPVSGRHERILSEIVSQSPIFNKKISKHAFASLPWKKPEFFKKIRGKKYKNIAVVGIGGSSLGARALCSAMGNGSIVFLDNIDSDYIKDALNKLDVKKTLFLLISKSGETIEIISLAKILLKIAPSGNFIAITDNSESTLGKLAKNRSIPVILSDEDVAGRFSVLSLVGLAPSSLADINVNKILDGAKQTSFDDALLFAALQYIHYSSGKNIAVIFPYSERLSLFADWYIQLLSESMGKSRKIGITPTKAIGVKDQHSQLQLFLDGPDDKFFILIKPQKKKTDFRIPSGNYSLNGLFDAEYLGVKKSLIARKKAFFEISFDLLDEKTIGSLFYFFELQVACLGLLFGVNTQNQPAVELSKKITKNILGVKKK